MNTRYIVTVGIIASLMCFSVLTGHGNCASSDKTPLVAMKPVVSEPESISYVGKALSRMLLTRLSSEGIDAVLVSETSSSDLMSVADFVITGKVVMATDSYEAFFELRSSKDGSLIKHWDLKASNLGVLARDTALLSAKISDTIKNTGDVLVANTVSNFAALSSSDLKKIKTDDEFAMARLHPDILVREKLEKDELREIEQQKRRAGAGVSPNRHASEAENDSFMPLPDVYDTGDDVPEDQNIENRYKDKKHASSSEAEDDSSFMPVPDVYDPDDDEDAVEKTKNLDVVGNTQGQEGGERVKVDTSQSSSGNSWYSWLWPFGDDNSKDKNEVPLVSQAKETRLQKEESDKEPIEISSVQELPIPAPPRVKFEIPEPVPLDEALSKIEDIKVEKRKKKHWLSWLWPWTEEESEGVGKHAFISQDASKGQAVAKQEETLQAFDSDRQIDAMRRHVGLEIDKPDSEGGIQSASSPEIMDSEEPEEGPSVSDSSHVKRPEQTEGPIWQWN